MLINKITLLAVIILNLILTACSKEADQITQGKQLFEQQQIGFLKSPGCIICHSLKEGVNIAGPSLYKIGKTAITRKTGMTARDYIYESIIDPAAYVVNGYRHDQMYAHYKDELDAEEISQLVAFLLSQTQ